MKVKKNYERTWLDLFQRNNLFRFCFCLLHKILVISENGWYNAANIFPNISICHVFCILFQFHATMINNVYTTKNMQMSRQLKKGVWIEISMETTSNFHRLTNFGKLKILTQLTKHSPTKCLTLHIIIIILVIQTINSNLPLMQNLRVEAHLTKLCKSFSIHLKYFH